MNDEGQARQRVSKAALIAMGAIVGALLFVAIFSNWQNAHRKKFESVTVTRFSPSPSPSATP
jgi:cell division septal protein FtsQ